MESRLPTAQPVRRYGCLRIVCVVLLQVVGRNHVCIVGQIRGCGKVGVYKFVAQTRGRGDVGALVVVVVSVFLGGIVVGDDRQSFFDVLTVAWVDLNARGKPSTMVTARGLAETALSTILRMLRKNAS